MAWHTAKNFASTTVSTGVLNNTTTPITFAVADGSVFGSTFPMYATVDPSGLPEVIEITARSTNNLTATRPNAVAHSGAPKIVCAVASEYINELQTAVDLKAPLASPALTGTPTAPTATGGTNTTQIATTAFVTSAVAGVTVTSNFQYATKTDTQTINSETWTDVLSVAITPTTNTKKIKLEGMVMVGPRANNANLLLRLVRGSTAIGIGDASSDRARITAAYYPGDPSGGATLETGVSTVPMIWVDEPATTSETTYKIQARRSTGGAGDVYINRTYADRDPYEGRGVTILIATEV